MESQEFDQLTRASAGASSRRTLVRGLVAVLAGTGVAAGLSLEADAGKSKKKKQQQRRKQQQKKKEEKKRECGSQGKVCATPTNPCQSVACEDFKCVISTRANGSSCGNGLTCEAGQCVCPGGVCNVTVSPSDMGGWTLFNEVTSSPIQATFMTGPATPPTGTGSAVLQTGGNPDKQMMATQLLNGTKLEDLTTLSYSTYVTNATATTAPHFQIGITRNINDPKNFWEGRLVFSPDYQTVVKLGEWQFWDILDPNQPWFFVTKGGYQDPVTLCTQSARCTFPQVLQHYPNIAINPVGPAPDGKGAGWGIIGVMVGSGEGTVNSSFDDVRIDTNDVKYRFNFEPNS